MSFSGSHGVCPWLRGPDGQFLAAWRWHGCFLTLLSAPCRPAGHTVPTLSNHTSCSHCFAFLFLHVKLTFSFSWTIVGLQCCISFWCTAKQFSFIRISQRRKWYPLRENPVDRGAWQAAVHGVTKSWTQLSTHLCYMLGFMSHQFFFRLFPIIGYYKILTIVPCAIQWDFVVYLYYIILYAAAAAKSLQSCPTLCDPIDGSPPGSPVPGILQARTLEWVAIILYRYLLIPYS